MALVKDTLGSRAQGIQYKIVSSAEVAGVDIGNNQDDHVVTEIPAGAVITGGSIHVTENFTGTLEALDVDLVDLDGLNNIVLVAAVDGDTAGRTVFNGAGITGNELTTPHYVVLRCDVGSDDGRAIIDVEYYVRGRSNENEG